MNNIANTPDNRELSASVNARLKADSRIINAKAAAWRLGGIGLLAFLLCCGVACLLLAYAKAQDATSAADKIALTLQKVLSEVTVKAEGSVLIDPNSKVALSDGGMVTMKEPAYVTLRDDGVGRAVARDLTPRETGVREDAPAAGSNADVNRRIKALEGDGKKIVSNFTKFFEIPWEGKLVTTGWVFKSSEDNAPSSQFCYTMMNDADGNQIRVPLAENNVMRTNIRARGFSPTEAAKVCFWHDGTKTRSY